MNSTSSKKRYIIEFSSSDKLKLKPDQICAECASKNGGIWLSEPEAEFVFGSCSKCDGICGITNPSNWDWPEGNPCNQGAK